jgi:hypothetical protein
MPIVIKNQIEASEKSAAEIRASLQNAHPFAMLRFDVEDLIKSIPDLVVRLDASVEHWRETCKAAPDALSMQEEWVAGYRSLEKLAENAITLIDEFARHGHQIDGKAGLMKLRAELHADNQFSVDRVEAAIQNLRAGRGVPLQAIKDAI